MPGDALVICDPDGCFVHLAGLSWWAVQIYRALDLDLYGLLVCCRSVRFEVEFLSRCLMVKNLLRGCLKWGFSRILTKELLGLI